MTRTHPRGCGLGTLAILLAISVAGSDARAGFNEDGKTDVVFANNGENEVCLGDGAGGFTCSNVSADTGPTLGAAALGDLDNNGTLDAVFPEAGMADPDRVCLNNGSGFDICSQVTRRNCEL